MKQRLKMKKRRRGKKINNNTNNIKKKNDKYSLIVKLGDKLAYSVPGTITYTLTPTIRTTTIAEMTS